MERKKCFYGKWDPNDYKKVSFQEIMNISILEVSHFSFITGRSDWKLSNNWISYTVTWIGSKVHHFSSAVIYFWQFSIRTPCSFIHFSSFWVSSSPFKLDYLFPTSRFTWDIDFSLWLCNLREFFQDVLCDFAHCFELMNHELRLLSSQALFSFLKLIEKPHFFNSCRDKSSGTLVRLLCHMSNLTQNSTQRQHVKKTRKKVTPEMFEKLQNIANYLMFLKQSGFTQKLLFTTHHQPWNLEKIVWKL